MTLTFHNELAAEMAHPGKSALERIQSTVRINRIDMPTSGEMLDILAYVQELETRLAKHDALITKAYEAGTEGEQAEDRREGFVPAVALYSPQWIFIARKMTSSAEEKRMGRTLPGEDQRKSYP